MPLSPEESKRYARHFTLPEVGQTGQEKLKSSSVLCIGAGGLGSPVALYLAAAGVGTIGIVDDDKVESSNLQRQIIHGESWIGKSKLDSAKARLLETNPHINVVTYPVKFTSSNAIEIAQGYDIIIDGTDNFPTRYLSNDVAFLLKKPNIYGSIFRFEGQMSVFAPHLGGPCYRCMLPEPPEPGSVPSCAEAGVLGVLPGIIGSLQAMEAIKLLLGAGKPPLGKLVHYDALNTNFRNFNLRKDPQCPLCSENPTVTELIDYEDFCGVKLPDTMTEITVTELKQKLDAGLDCILIDVRLPAENAVCSIPSSKLIPLPEIENAAAELPKDKPLYIHCKGGVRSARACTYLAKLGFTQLVNIKGGMDAWLEM
ncbi:MAG: molybdopterin/thiamine biosynthesis adenylyltransferase/rhodanese-related sulfurtransferase [Cryomorphaceae bacterium]|jgi:molybdopterin/thiamine biosynthesis adenylyltransferase/rhodanese-related sulfurtransferase